MSTAINESYFSIRARIVGTEPEQPVGRPVHYPDPVEEIQRCLNCKYHDCTDTCPHSPYYRKPKPKKPRKSIDFKQVYVSKLSEDERLKASEVARLHMDGWTEGGIAWKLGITRKEVELFMNVAKKAGYLD